MTSSFSGLGIALSALMAQRTGIDAAGHNVANANTPGYSRQEVLLATRVPIPGPYSRWRFAVGQVGTGVEAAGLRRLRDAFHDLQLRQQTEALGRWQAKADVLRRLEELMTEPSDSGLASLLSRFWNAWDELAGSPTSAGARASLLGQARDLAHRLNQTYSQLGVVRSELDCRVVVQVQAVNGIANEIAALNSQIKNVQTFGEQPNDLRDRRDLLMDRLAGLASFRAYEDQYGSVSIYVGGTALVDGQLVNEMAVVPGGDGVGQLVWSRGGQPVALADGEIRGLLDARDGSVPARMEKLNRLAAALIDGVNQLHSTGYGIDGSTGLDFFVGAGARDIAVNPGLLANHGAIAAASGPDAAGDGSLAQLIADCRRQGVAALGDATIDGFHEALVVELGVDAQQASGAKENQGVVVKHLARQRESLAGVSLDEEATNLVRFQHAYAAAAQFMSVVDDMLDRLINVVGAAGR